MTALDESKPHAPFTVQTEVFSGTLGELAYALRSGNLKPQDLDVHTLVTEYLAYFDEIAQDDLNLASEALPMVARVVELKIRFLLPRPPKEKDELEEELLEETLETLTLLEDLEEAISFLKQRREARRIVLPATAPRPEYPRAERPIKIGPDKLMQLASRYSFSAYFEMAIERLTMASAMKSLMKTLKRLQRGRLSDLIEHKTWTVLAITFTGMLELYKEGKLKATQSEPYEPIEIELSHIQEKREAA